MHISPANTYKEEFKFRSKTGGDGKRTIVKLFFGSKCCSSDFHEAPGGAFFLRSVAPLVFEDSTTGSGSCFSLMDILKILARDRGLMDVNDNEGDGSGIVHALTGT